MTKKRTWIGVAPAAVALLAMLTVSSGGGEAQVAYGQSVHWAWCFGSHGAYYKGGDFVYFSMVFPVYGPTPSGSDPGGATQFRDFLDRRYNLRVEVRCKAQAERQAAMIEKEYFKAKRLGSVGTFGIETEWFPDLDVKVVNADVEIVDLQTRNGPSPYDSLEHEDDKWTWCSVFDGKTTFFSDIHVTQLVGDAPPRRIFGPNSSFSNFVEQQFQTRVGQPGCSYSNSYANAAERLKYTRERAPGRRIVLTRYPNHTEGRRRASP